MMILYYATLWLFIIHASFTDGLYPSFLYDVPSGLILLLHNIITFRNMPWKGIIS